MMNFVKNIIPGIKYVPEYDPTDYPDIKALTYDGLPIGGMKTKVFAYIGYPADCKNLNSEKLPAMVLVHGGGGHAFFEWVRLWNEAGYAAIAMDTTGFYPVRVNAGIRDGDSENWGYGIKANPDFDEEGYADAPTNDGMSSSDKELDAQWMYHAVADTILAHNILRNDDRVDNEKIGLTGISWGGVITSIAIGYDDRYAFAIPIFGSGYLSKSLGSINKCFDNEATRKLWYAEHNFDKVKYPVFWFCWNDDTSFSIDANSKSYNDTVKNNPLTVISIKDKMYHSHYYGWIWKENYFFADSIVKNTTPFPRFLNQPKGKNIECKLFIPDGIQVSANVFYIDSPMTYSRHEKHGIKDCIFMDQEWKSYHIGITGDMIKCTLPDSAAGYYIELVTEIGGYKYISSSEYIY